MIGKVAAPKGGSNTTLAFNWAGDRSVEYASHPRVPRRITWDLLREPTGTAAAGPLQSSGASLPHSAQRLQSCIALAFGVQGGRRIGNRGGLAGPLAAGSTQTSRSAHGATGSPPATTRHSMSAPRDFWMVLQKMGPDFDTSLGFWAVCCGRGSLQTSPTWGNAGSSRPFKPKPPAKPPRSSEQDCTMRKPALPTQSTCASIRANRPNPQHEAPARTLGTESPKRTAPRMKTL